MLPPRLLHFATHGFFLPTEVAEMQPAGSAPPSPAASPLEAMRRASLALAGAQDALEALARGARRPAADDGLLTAEEVGTLNLQGTWLVALSACDTGTGEILAGEGVLGLRRGFVQAGAHNLLMTLWPINDEATVEIMLKFYEQAFQTGDAPGSLGTVQRDALVRLRLEQGLLRAVTLAGAFIMSSQGK